MERPGGLDDGRIIRGHSEVLEAFEDYYDTWEG